MKSSKSILSVKIKKYCMALATFSFPLLWGMLGN